MVAPSEAVGTLENLQRIAETITDAHIQSIFWTIAFAMQQVRNGRLAEVGLPEVVKANLAEKKVEKVLAQEVVEGDQNTRLMVAARIIKDNPSERVTLSQLYPAVLGTLEDLSHISPAILFAHLSTNAVMTYPALSLLMEQSPYLQHITYAASLELWFRGRKVEMLHEAGIMVSSTKVSWSGNRQVRRHHPPAP